MTQNDLRFWGFFLFLMFIFSGDPDVWDAVKNKILVWGGVSELTAPGVETQIG